MVVKLCEHFSHHIRSFENGVVSYGGQTNYFIIYSWLTFENGVVSYGGQTIIPLIVCGPKFENGVVSYGGQTAKN